MICDVTNIIKPKNNLKYSDLGFLITDVYSHQGKAIFFDNEMISNFYFEKTQIIFLQC